MCRRTHPLALKFVIGDGRERLDGFKSYNTKFPFVLLDHVRRRRYRLYTVCSRVHAVNRDGILYSALLFIGTLYRTVLRTVNRESAPQAIEWGSVAPRLVQWVW